MINITRDQDGKPINIELEENKPFVIPFVNTDNEFSICNIDFPIPNRELSPHEFMTIRHQVNTEMIMYAIETPRPKDPKKAAKALAVKMSQVLAKYFKQHGVL